MKICPNCQAGNSDETFLCKDCGSSLGAAPVLDGETLIATEIGNYERRQLRLRRLNLAWAILLGVLNVCFLAVAIYRGTFIFMMVLPQLAVYAAVHLAEVWFTRRSRKLPINWLYLKLLLLLLTVAMGYEAFR